MLKNINKRILVIVLTTIVVIAGISSFIINQKPDLLTPSPSPLPKSKLDITPFETESENITHNVSIKPMSSPDLYLYKTSPGIDETEVLDIFGFTNTSPIRTETQFKEWYLQGRGKLFIHKLPDYVFFKPDRDVSWVTNLLDKKTDYETRAKSLLGSAKLSDGLLLLDTVYIKANEYNQVPAVTSNQANLISFYFAYNQDGLPLIMTNRPPASIIITLTSSGELFDLTFYPKPQIVSKTKIKPISLNEAVEVLKSNQGILLSVESNVQSELSFTPDFNTTSIGRQSFLYYYNKDQIIPAYYFGGSARDNAQNEVEYSIKYLVPTLTE